MDSLQVGGILGTAKLKAEGLSQFCPTTNFYECSDGKHLLVTVPTLDSPGTLAQTLGIVVPVAQSHMPKRVDVFLADSNATVLDADDNPANGMTPLFSYDDCESHDDALLRAGYELVG